MAEDSGWSEKGKGSGRGKRPPKEQRDDDAADTGAAEGPDETADTGETGADEPSSAAPEPRKATTKAPSRPSKRAEASDADSGSTIVRARADDDDGARKVARAAATAGQRDIAFLSRLGFPALIAFICLLGVAVVFYAWTTREALARPSQADHWHAVYGVYDCTSASEDRYVPPFQSARDETGIHSHGDGIIHIHPFFELSSGDNAQMRHFFSEMGIEVTPERIVLDNGVQLLPGTECADGSGAAEIRILHWDFDFQALADDPPDPEVITADFGEIHFDNDREVYIIAFAGPDADLPIPPQDRFNTLNSVSAEIEYNPTDLIPRDTGVTDDGATVTGESEDGTTVTGTTDDSDE